jgi:hypothetical protein
VRPEIGWSPICDRHHPGANSTVVNQDVEILSLPTMRIIGI